MDHKIIEYTCEYCNQVFISSKLKANHIRWYHKENKYTANGLQRLKEKTKINNDKKFGKKIKENVNCFVCQKNIDIEYRVGKKKEKYFCGKSCANKRSNILNQESIAKISSSLKKYHRENDIILNNCNKRIFTSIGEKEIRNFFIKNFPNDGWTFGGRIIFKDESIVRDLYSDSLKVMVEYDGIWHFKDIKNQLVMKQKKDLLMEEWVLLNDWRLIRVKEEIYKSDKEKTIELIKNLIYNSSEKIVKLY
jgi:hypothetical protein